MLALASLVEKHAETLATIETWDNGKPYGVALNEDVAEVAGTLRYYAGWADKVHGQVINTSPVSYATGSSLRPSQLQRYTKDGIRDTNFCSDQEILTSLHTGQIRIYA